MHTHTHTSAWRRRSERNSQGLVLSVHHVGLGDWTHVTRLWPQAPLSAEPCHQPNKTVFLTGCFKEPKFLSLMRFYAVRSEATGWSGHAHQQQGLSYSSRGTSQPSADSLPVSGFQDAYRLCIASLRASEGYGHMPLPIS